MICLAVLVCWASRPDSCILSNHAWAQLGGSLGSNCSQYTDEAVLGKTGFILSLTYAVQLAFRARDQILILLHTLRTIACTFVQTQPWSPYMVIFSSFHEFTISCMLAWSWAIAETRTQINRWFFSVRICPSIDAYPCLLYDSETLPSK